MEVGFSHYHRACAWALKYNEALLWATVERVEMYLEIFLEAGRPDQALAFCQRFQQKPADVETALWQPVASHFNELEMVLLSGQVTADLLRKLAEE